MRWNVCLSFQTAAHTNEIPFSATFLSLRFYVFKMPHEKKELKRKNSCG
jgi:hypothetical protein